MWFFLVILLADLDGAGPAIVCKVLAHSVFIIESPACHGPGIICLDALRLQVVDDEAGDFGENLTDVLARLRTRLEEREAVLFSEGTASFRIYLLLLVGQVRLVCDEYLLNVGLRVCFDLLEPILNIVESDLFGAVVDEQNAHGSFVVGLGDSPKSLLASSVPDLQLDVLVHYVYCFDSEVDSNGWHVTRRELIVRKTEQQARFADR